MPIQPQDLLNSPAQWPTLQPAIDQIADLERQITHTLQAISSHDLVQDLANLAIAAADITLDGARGDTHARQSYRRIIELFHADRPIPTAWWNTPVGELCLAARLRIDGDALITPSQASAISGRSLSFLSNMVSQGKLTRFLDLQQPNPTKQTRLLRSEIKALPPTKKRQALD